MELLSSGVDHANVAARNPDWSVEDWCLYWERDARKIERKYDVRWDRLMDCGEKCRCRGLNGPR